MREIKFRGWDTIQNKFLEDYKLFCRVTSEVNRRSRMKVNYISFGKPDPSDETIFQQYIGRKDSKGRDIYEGDIVAVQLTGPCETSKPILGTIVWDEEESCFGIQTKVAGEDDLWSFMYTELTVVGNIFENPELLK